MHKNSNWILFYLQNIQLNPISKNLIGSGLLFKAVCFDFFSTNVGSSVIGTCTSNGVDDITH